MACQYDREMIETIAEDPMNITDLLKFCTQQNGSDLHLSTGLPPVLRVDGDIRRINAPTLTADDMMRMIKEILSEKGLKELSENKEADFSYEAPGICRFRVNAFYHSRGLGMVFRTISKVQSMEALGLGEIFKDISMKPRGLCLVTGPTGSGKSTTLAAMIDYINEKTVNFVLLGSTGDDATCYCIYWCGKYVGVHYQRSC